MGIQTDVKVMSFRELQLVLLKWMQGMDPNSSGMLQWI